MKSVLTFVANAIGIKNEMQSDNKQKPESLEESLTAAKSADQTNGAEMKKSIGETKSAPIDIPGSKARQSVFGDADDDDFIRYCCTGRPPKPPFEAFFSSALDSPTRSQNSRRATIAEKPDLNSKLVATLILHKGDHYLPLTLKNIHRLSALWKGTAPVADFGLFKRLIINEDINITHASHFLDALEFIGHHCEYLVVAGPILVSEYKDVFYREELNIGTGDDWSKVMERFPNLKSTSYERDLKI
ncbi:hypothetical protein P171DRAFT_443329 [Karstenula rhodostoma CBS 690.94]|uniref:Uncharacterized protein n=1 Tax=Karstenula rhodostoma CBS 690.94 TaxID=1392251 RepID=A0A9P4PM77_9PLEO|nr:hypothetical protein P171DRAFT_443329 [Karstenula rhodostoma CBS 690.94]